MKIKDYADFFIPLIEEEIKKKIPSNFKSKNLYDSMTYALESGGKKLRPALCLAVCKILGGKVDEALPFAASIEIIHNASLVHDDIEDGDEIRRGKPSVWKKYGVAHGINIGDALIFKSYENLLKTKNLDKKDFIDLLELFTFSLTKITEGQCMDFNFRERSSVTIEEYIDMTNRKCGVLFGAALCGGAIVAKRKDVAENLKDFGTKIGSAFQIRDDILNIIGKQENYGKEICGDIKEGKRSILVVHCLSLCNEGEKREFLNILNKGRTNVNETDMCFAKKLFEKYGSIQFVQDYSKKLVEEALSCVDKIDNGELKEMLKEVALFAIERDY